MRRRRECGPGLELNEAAKRAEKVERVERVEKAARHVSAVAHPGEAGYAARVPAQRMSAAQRRDLVDRIIERVRTRQLSPKTEKTYAGWVKRYLTFHGHRDPTDFGASEVEDFLTYLSVERGLSASSQNQAHAAVLFLHREVYQRDLSADTRGSRAKAVETLPRYASPEEVSRVLAELSDLPFLAALLAYGSGMRVEEVISLRVKDVSLDRGEITVRHGKGGKDRVTVIAEAAVPVLRGRLKEISIQHERDRLNGEGWATLPRALHRKDPTAGWALGWQFVFSSRRVTRDPQTGYRGRRPIAETTIQRPFKEAVQRSGVVANVTLHVLRHAFATELNAAGHGLAVLKKILGHEDIRTTIRYVHPFKKGGLKITSPLDRLPGGLPKKRSRGRSRGLTLS